jgi:tetratricopeptide (TPR) repeat protein
MPENRYTNKKQNAPLPGKKTKGQNACSRKQVVVVSLGLAAVTIAAYWPVGWNGFVRYDDASYITVNSYVMRGLSWEGIKWAFCEFHSGNWHPLTWISHMADVEVFGLRPWGHHAVSLGFHVLNTMLVLFLLEHTTKRLWASAFVAGLFALHPLHVESVAWAAERKDVLSTFFWLSTMLAYVWYTKKSGWRRYLAVAALLAMGLMSKPMLVTLPVVLLLLDYWPLDRLAMNWQTIRRRVIEKLPLLAIAVISSAITMKAQDIAITDLGTLSVWARLANAVVSYGRYVWAMVWPTGLAVFYPFEVSISQAVVAASVVFLVAGTVVAFHVGRKHKYVIVGWLWYLVTLIPVIGIVQVGSQSHADRYTYVPLVGLFVVIAWWAAETAQEYALARRVFAVTGFGILVAMAVMTWRQVGYWKDDLALFGRAVAVTENNPVALCNLGAALGEQGRMDEGLAAMRKSLSLSPHDEQNLAEMGRLLSSRGQVDKAIEYYQKAIALRPDLKEPYMGMASVLIRVGRFEEAEKCCRMAIELDGKWPEVYHMLGMILGQTGRTDEALEAFRLAAETYPGMASARLNMAKLYAARGELDRAIDECRKSIAMEPYYAEYDCLGELYARAGRLAEAEQAFREAARMAPEAAEVRYHLGVLLAQMGRRTEAVAEVKQAMMLDPNDGGIAQYYQRLLMENR